jgi:hypothetical protein
MRPVEVIYVSENFYSPSVFGLSPSRSISPIQVVDVSTLPPPPRERGSIDDARELLLRRAVASEHKDKLLLLLNGQSFEAPGKRNESMYRLVSAVVFMTARTNRLRATDYADLFRASLSVWSAEPGASKTLDEEMAVVIGMIDSALLDFDTKWLAQKQEEAKIARALKINLRFDGDHVEALDHRATIIQSKNTYYIHNFGLQDANPLTPGYYGPFIEKEVLPALNNFWENCPTPYELTYQTDPTDKKPEGTTKQKTVPRLMQEYGSLALDVLGDLSLDKSYFDLKTRVFHEAICPIRKLDPVFSPTFDEYLHVAFDTDYSKFVDYLSYFLRLDMAIGAPYIEGPSGAGKGALVAGLSRFWGKTGPTDYERVAASDFNAFQVPFIVLDEGLSVSRKTSAHIRHLIATGSHTVNPKGLPQYVVNGHVRVMFTANNKNVFAQITSNEELSEDDIDAIARRFIYFRMSDDAPRWISERNEGVKKLTTQWVEEDGIAKHVLWLAQNHQSSVLPGKRFVVEGESSEIHRALVTRGEKRGLVLEWLARFATDPTSFERHPDPKRRDLAKIGNGHLLVNTRAVSENWSLYGEKSPPLTVTMIGRILGQISSRVRLGHDPKAGVSGTRYHNINFDHILDWSGGDAQIGDLEKMRENFQREIEEEEEQ